MEGHHKSMVSTLLRQVDASVIDMRDNTGQAAMHLACAGGYTDTVSILLENGATTDSTDRALGTPEMLDHVDGSDDIPALL